MHYMVPKPYVFKFCLLYAAVAARAGARGLAAVLPELQKDKARLSCKPCQAESRKRSESSWLDPNMRLGLEQPKPTSQ